MGRRLIRAWGSTTMASPASEASAGDGAKVLLAEDTLHMRLMLRGLLRANGAANVVDCENGIEAFQVLSKFMVDVVITDWEMPSLTGVGLCKLVRNHAKSVNPFVPIIMLTANNQAKHIEQARDAGVNALITKPVSPAMMRQRLQQALGVPASFILTPDYFGPDRRRRPPPAPPSPERRLRQPDSDFTTAVGALRISRETVAAALGTCAAVQGHGSSQEFDILKSDLKTALTRLLRHDIALLLAKGEQISPNDPEGWRHHCGLVEAAVQRFLLVRPELSASLRPFLTQLRQMENSPRDLETPSKVLRSIVQEIGKL